MTWRRRWRAWLRAKLHEVKVRSQGAWKGWHEPQFVLLPPWNPSMTSGTRWNRELLFTQDRSVLGVFIEVDNLLLHKPEIAAAAVGNKAREMARYATQLEVERLDAR